MTSYTGGKGGSGVYQTIINQMPPHRVYIEAFAGAGSVLRAKRPATSTIAIDRDGDVLAQHWRGDEVPGLQLVNTDALKWLRARRWRGDELVYCDPPYLMDTRSTRRNYYRCELATAREHKRLLAVVKALPVPVLISGYWSELYACELRDWRSLSFTTTTRGGPATEWLWMNYSAPTALHDYRYLGRNFRERERINRQARRWKARLARMDELQRRALLWAMQEAGWPPSPDLAVGAPIVRNDGAEASPEVASIEAR